MRIGIVANTTWNIYKFRLNVIEELVEQGYEVFVIAPVDEFLEYKERYPSVRHVPLRFLHRDGLNPIKDLLLMAELYRKYRRLKLKVILHYTHKPNIFGSWAASWAGIYSVSVITGLGYAFINPGITKWLAKLLYKLTMKKNQNVLFENQDDLQEFRKIGIIDKDSGQALKGCGVDLTYYKPIKRDHTEEEGTVFTFVGRLLKDKGISEYVAAARQIKKTRRNVQFWVIGDLDEGNPSTISKGKLAQWVNEKVIDYHGFVRDVRPFLRKTTCVVLPTYREGMPRIIMEAMAMSLPVIATDVPGCREIVQHGVTGFLVPKKSVADLVSAIDAFLETKAETRLLMGQKARKFAVASFDERKIARQIVDVINGAVGHIQSVDVRPLPLPHH